MMEKLAGQLDIFGGEIRENADYHAFVEKFKPKKTTDDCCTPEMVYDAVAKWVEKEYGVAREAMVRPFWPGADYTTAEYTEGCVVVDNPPFSIITQIVRHYLRREIRFFLFAPTLTLLSGHEKNVCHIPCGVSITYENGAKVNTSFLTNLDTWLLRTAPDLYRAVDDANTRNQNMRKTELPKYSYPDCVLTAAKAYQYSQHGVDFRVRPEECVFIRAMDHQRNEGKTIFGSGLLLSERAAAERAAAERAAAERAGALVWELSDREKQIVKMLGERTARGKG